MYDTSGIHENSFLFTRACLKEGGYWPEIIQNYIPLNKIYIIKQNTVLSRSIYFFKENITKFLFGSYSRRGGNMSVTKKYMPQILFTLKCLLFSYILTGGFLLLLAFLLYRLHLSEKVVNVCIILIYIAASFFAGFLTGKKKGRKKFFWGAIMGALYFVVLFAVSVIVNRSFPQLSTDFSTTVLLCVGGGMLGGMLS